MVTEAMIPPSQACSTRNSLDYNSGRTAINTASSKSMIPAKQEALESIRKLPDDADMEAIMYQLYVIDKVRKGQDAVNKGQLTTSEELLREIEQW